MRAVWTTKVGPPEVLEVREAPDPIPGAGEVRIRVRAAGLNFADVMARQGLYPDAPKLPCIMGYEVAGEIDALGDTSTGFTSGQRVVALCRFGGHADTVVVAADQVRVMPDSMRFSDAAALPVNYVTAFHILFRVACVRPGERVLVHMAAGGVGTAALQLCRSIGDVTVFGTASAAKHAYIREHGCTYPIDYHHQDYATEILRYTDGQGVDVVLDPLGGSDWRKGYKLLREAGRLVTFGFANMSVGSRRNLWHVLRQWLRVPRFNPLTLMNDNRSVAGVNLGHLWRAKHLLVDEVDALLQLYTQGAIKPHIDSTFAFADVASAHRRMEARQNLGKIILVP